MKNLKMLLFVFTACFYSQAQNQAIDYSNYEQSTGIRVFAGYNSFELSEAKDFFRNEIESYNKFNINVKEQTIYPANSLLGFGLYFFPLRELELYLNAEFTNTKAISLYGDQFGEIDIKSEIELFTVEIGIKKYFMEISLIQPFVGLNVGIVNGKYKLNESTSFFQVSEFNREGTMDFTKLGYKAEINVGFSYNVWVAVLDVDAGYRYSIIPKPDREDFGNGPFSEQMFELNNSGFVFKIGVRTGIYW